MNKNPEYEHTPSIVKITKYDLINTFATTNGHISIYSCLGEDVLGRKWQFCVKYITINGITMSQDGFFHPLFNKSEMWNPLGEDDE